MGVKLNLNLIGRILKYPPLCSSTKIKESLMVIAITMKLFRNQEIVVLEEVYHVLQ